jgi:AcrR family transcriptional regulator
MAVVRPYKGVSAEDRRADRRARLLEAALDIAGEDGLSGVTMKAVCARAGLTERYYYESFRSRDELLVGVTAPFLAEIGAEVARALAETPPDLYTRSRAAAAAVVRGLTEDRRKARIFVESVADEALRAQRSEVIRAYAALVADQMRELRGLTAKRYRGRIDAAALVLVGGTTQAVASWLDGTLELDRDDLIDEVARLCVAAAGTVAAA